MPSWLGYSYGLSRSLSHTLYMFETLRVIDANSVYVHIGRKRHVQISEPHQLGLMFFHRSQGSKVRCRGRQDLQSTLWDRAIY